MGRPPLPAPDDFAETFVTHGWEAKDILGMRTSRFKRVVAECGEDLKRRRKNYVLGRRLTSLKVGMRAV